MIIRWVRTLGWPWRTDMIVRDEAGRALAHYDSSDPSAVLPRSERARSALERLTRQQLLLQLHYGTQDAVRLQSDPADTDRLGRLLKPYKITPKMCELTSWEELQVALFDLRIEDLWRLVADWYDEYEVDQLVGTSQAHPPQWLRLAHPEQQSYWQWLSTQAGSESGRALFMQHYGTLDLELMTMYDLLHWVLAARSEFAADHAGGQLPPAAALSQLAALAAPEA